MANTLVWRLGRDTEAAQYFGLEWAVGVFRSETGTETVVHSNEGFGYIPAGVCVPRGVQVLSADPLADTDFRQRWFGWHDSARVMVEYAEKRRVEGWTLVAAATSGSVEAYRRAGVEHSVSCTRDNIPAHLAAESPAVIGDLHVHRLQASHAELYGRIQAMAGVADVGQLNRVVAPCAAELWKAVRHYGVDVPDELHQVWDLLSASRDVPADVWDRYRQAYGMCYVATGAARPGYAMPGEAMLDPENDPRDRRLYLTQWIVTRTMELVSGWAATPIAVADMVYAAIASGTSSERDVAEGPLRLVENELGSAA